MADAEPKAAVLAAVARAEARAAGQEPETQFELLPPTRFDAVDDAQSHANLTTAVKRDRAGRPPGARNLATRDMLDFIRKTMGDPLQELARWAMHTPETLARELNCDVLEAFDRLVKIRIELAGYFHAKQAAVDDTGQPAVPRLTVTIGGHAAPGSVMLSADQPPWEYLKAVNANHQQNQPLELQASARSHGDQSHGDE